MRKLKLIILLLTLSFGLKSQAYFPLPDSNAIWTNSALSQGWMKYNYKFGLFGDTTINNIVYRKIYADYNNLHFNLSGSSIAAIIRQQNKKVYRYFGGADEVLYDFNLGVGDTAKSISSIGGYYKKKVLSIDSIQINGQFRKRWNFQNEYWIDGIGSSIDLLNPLWQGFDVCISLLCMSNDSIIIYQNPIPDCTTPLPYDCDGVLNPASVQEHSLENNKSIIFPNPFSNSAIIKTSIELNDATLIVYDILGQKTLINHHLSGQEIKINKGNLNSGNYYYHLSQNGDLISKGKFILE